MVSSTWFFDLPNTQFLYSVQLFSELIRHVLDVIRDLGAAFQSSRMDNVFKKPRLNIQTCLEVFNSK